MVQRGCERNVITYSSLISACEKAGRCELALQLFEQMHKEGCMPNVVTYNSLIAACSHGEPAADLQLLVLACWGVVWLVSCCHSAVVLEMHWFFTIRSMLCVTCMPWTSRCLAFVH
jgi:pentatricopeptide repeat protein